jgi:hypothetical protein
MLILRQSQHVVVGEPCEANRRLRPRPTGADGLVDQFQEGCLQVELTFGDAILYIEIATRPRSTGFAIDTAKR